MHTAGLGGTSDESVNKGKTASASWHVHRRRYDRKCDGDARTPAGRHKSLGEECGSGGTPQSSGKGAVRKGLEPLHRVRARASGSRERVPDRGAGAQARGGGCGRPPGGLAAGEKGLEDGRDLAGQVPWALQPCD